MNKPLAAACLMLAACGSVQVEPPEEDTITPLEQACLRDPLDPAKWEQLAAALAITGERERAAAMYLQAASLRAHDVKQDYATLKQAAESHDGVPRTQVRQLAPGLVEVTRTHVANAVAASVAGAAIVRLEISNGNGVTGAAARLARSLDMDGVKTVRLSNVRPFVEPESRIEYQREQQKMAQALGRRLNLPLQPARGATAYADLRIVLGHDVRYLK
ncbi:LytR cell envelope-related transcriptional attenuator [Duganella sp. CF402]|nr:LytR cell envelope-related transcriptional attenuator [Duganella sp. BK701]SEM89941.1 LytR cell envelope-related transcriptional attenuator [Duganella sp. CF402]